MKKVILIIGDTQILIDTIETILSSEGYDIVIAEHHNFFQVIEDQNPQLILFDLDLNFPTANQLFKKIKNSNASSDIPIMILSSRNYDHGKSKVGVSDLVFSKPFELLDFLGAIAAFFICT